jgi:hypothetical protein
LTEKKRFQYLYLYECKGSGLKMRSLRNFFDGERRPSQKKPKIFGSVLGFDGFNGHFASSETNLIQIYVRTRRT